MIKKDDLIGAIHEGTKDAHKDFEWLSGGRWISDTIARRAEGFLVSKILLAIRERMGEGETLVVELPFEYIKQWTGSKVRGRPLKGWSPTNRVDIALFNKSKKPIHVIEVKLKWDDVLCKKDIEKIATLLRIASHKRRGSLQRGYLSVHYQGTNRPHLKEKMDKAEKFVLGLDMKEMNVKFDRKVWPAEDKFEKRRMHDGKEYQYGSHVIELSRKYKKKT